MDVLAIILIFGLISSSTNCLNAIADSNTFSVVDYGAVGDGIRDDSQAFLKAWSSMCSMATGIPTMIIPGGKTFFVNPVVFNGPCKAKNVAVQIWGNIVAPSNPDTWKGLDQSEWLVFNGVSGLNISGQGSINGRGSGWWDQSCRDHPTLPQCTQLAPTAVRFLSCNETSLSGVFITDSPQAHILVMGCNGVYINNLVIKAPESSPNTDGIHIQSSHHVLIHNVNIGTGDDCVSIGDYTSDVNISYANCGPGHGISIGSLGRDGNFVQVENINVKHVNFYGTTNGARIKTWQVGKGFSRGIVFERLNFTAVKNPIIIDQNYCDVRGACKEMTTGVYISDVTYNGLYGTSSTHVAINLNCSQSVACTGISLQSIQLWSETRGQQVISSCNNAYGSDTGVVQPSSCLQK